MSPVDPSESALGCKNGTESRRLALGNRTATCFLIVKRMLKLHKDLPKARTAPDKTDGKRIVNFE